MRKHLYLIILIGILFLGVILRFANTPERYSFDGDAVRDAIVAYEGAKHFAFPLAGPFSSTGPYTFGPWYYIGLILFSVVFPTPYAPWILMSILSLFTILLMADIGRLLYSKTFGIILAVLTAIAPAQINMGTGLSNINPVVFFVTLSLWITFKLMRKEFSHSLWYLVLGLTLGLGMNMHYQTVGLLLLPLLLWIQQGWKKYHIPLFIGLGVFLTFIPLLIFNLLTNWHTINGLNEMLIAKERMYVPNSWKIYLVDFWVAHLQFLLSSPTMVNLFFVFTFVVVFVKDIVKKKYSAGLIMLTVIFSANFLWLRYYWGERHDVYLYYLSPILFIFLGYVLFSFLQMKYGKIFFILLSLILGWHMLSKDYTRITNVVVDTPRQEVKLLHEKYPDTNLLLYSCDPHYEPHKRTLAYLLKFYERPQSQGKKLGMKNNSCHYPKMNKETRATFLLNKKTEADVYPPLLPHLKEAHFNFIDLSPATPEVFEEESWQLISTTDVFNTTINWWKK